jgi:quercetin dioxygenase-like cupin family protein
MRSLSTIDLPAELARLAADLAAEAGTGPWTPPPEARAGTGPVGAVPGGPPGPALPDDRPWSVPLLVTPEAEAWLVEWPAGLVTRAHDHGGATVAVTVVEGTLSEECLDPTIWTTGRRTTWRAGATTVFPPGHVHLLGAAGDRPAVAVHAWSRSARSGGDAAGRLAPVRAGGAGGRGPGRRGDAAEPVGIGPGRGGNGCRPDHPAHGALDLRHVRDRVAG